MGEATYSHRKRSQLWRDMQHTNHHIIMEACHVQEHQQVHLILQPALPCLMSPPTPPQRHLVQSQTTPGSLPHLSASYILDHAHPPLTPTSGPSARCVWPTMAKDCPAALCQTATLMTPLSPPIPRMRSGSGSAQHSLPPSRACSSCWPVPGHTRLQVRL